MTIPVKPASFSAVTVRSTCSMQGLKQQIRVIRSLCQTQSVLRMHGKALTAVKRVTEWRCFTLNAFLACSTASQGIGRSRNTARKRSFSAYEALSMPERMYRHVPASTVSATVNPSLHTFLWVRVTMSSMPWRLNSSLERLCQSDIIQPTPGRTWDPLEHQRMVRKCCK